MLMLGVALATHSTIDVMGLNVLVVSNDSWIRLEWLVLLSDHLLCLDLHMSLRLGLGQMLSKLMTLRLGAIL